MARTRSDTGFFGVFEEMVSRGVGEARAGVTPWLPEIYPLMAQGQMDELQPVERAAREVGGPILELGCGTGRLVIPLARQGYAVTGVERNPASLESLGEKLARAPEKVRRRVEILPADMREFATEKRFRLAFYSANTFLYLVTPDQQIESLRRVHEHLEPGGLLLVDVYLPRNGWGHEEPFWRTAFDRQTGEFALYMSQAKHDPLRGHTLLNAATLYTRPGEPPRIWVQSWEEASLTPKELWLLLKNCGFEVLRVEGDYQGGPLTRETIQAVTVARRKLEGRPQHAVPEGPQLLSCGGETA